jgi:hypothetical protein
MIYRKYGSTGIDVSAIGFGGMRFADQSDVDACASLLKACYDKGINYFDTAPGYEKSEDLFGVALKEMQKTRSEKLFYCSTKTEKSDPAEIRRELETSLKRMNLDYIDFYHVWCVMSPEEYRQRKQKGALREFERLKEEGLIRYICISTHTDGAEMGEILRDYPFEGVLLGYSAMNFPYRDAGIETAASLGMGVVIMNPLGGGIIPHNPERFDFVRTRDDETVVEASLRLLLNDPRITVALVGMSNLDHLAESISSVDGFRPIPPQAVTKIRQGLRGAFNELCTSCCYCNKCPQSIEVPKMMDAYNHFVLTGKSIDLINRLRWHWGFKLDENFVNNCTECGICERACTQKLPIRDRLKTIRYEVQKFIAAQKTT